jgi:alkaline phosphatase
VKLNKRIILSAAIALLISPLFVWASGQAEVVQESDAATAGKPAKYVFLFIGDGMGIPQMNAAEHYLAASSGKKSGSQKLSFSDFPAQAFTTTYANDRFITGSAAAATAMATGYKTNIGVISMDPGKTRSYKTIAEMAKEAGMKVGIISSVSIDHATPASFYAHQPSRNLYYQIDLDLADSGFDFFGGGGMRQKGREEGQADAYDVAAQKGYKIVRNRNDFLTLQPGVGKVLASNEVLKGGDSLPYELDRADDDISLADYTSKAIELLDNDNGFFMMVEGGKIDWACHANDAAPAIYDTLAFDDAVKEALDFYAQHPDETLIVVTGDHECGGMTLGFAGTKYETSFDLISKQKKSATDYFAEELLAQYRDSGRTVSEEQLFEVVEAQFGLVKISSSERASLEAKAKAGNVQAEETLKLALNEYELNQIRRAFVRSMGGEVEKSANEETYLLYGGYDPLAVTLSHILNQKAGIGWTSYKHTGVPVPTFAKGRNYEIFNGYYDNTDIAKKIMQVMQIEQKVAVK